MRRHTCSPLTIGLVTLLLGLVGCETPPADPVLASFGAQSITQSDVDAFFVAGAGRQREPREILRDMALTATLAQAAENFGLDTEPVLAMQLRRLADRPWIRTLESKVRADNEPTEEAVAEYLDDNRSKLEKPRKIRLWNIFKRSPSNASKAQRGTVRDQMQAIHQRLLSGEDFGAIAKLESEAVNRFRGGKMGAVPPGQLKKAVDDIAFALAEGETSPIIDVGEGFVILRNAGFVEATTMSEEDALERIRSAMRRWNYEAAWEALRAELFAADGVVFDDDAVAAATAETEIGRISGDIVTYGEIDRFARSQGAGEQPARLTDARIRSVFLAQAFGRLAAARSRELALEPAPERSSEVHWRQQKLLADAEIERQAQAAMTKISEQEALAFFEAHPKFFALPAQALISLFQRRLDEGDKQTVGAQTAVARQALERIQSGEISFADAARELSQHPSAAAGGDIGWKPRRWAAALGPNVLNAFDKLEPGQMTDVVRQDHLWILQLRDRREGRAQTFDEVREQARWGVEQERLKALSAELKAEALAQIHAGLEILELPEIPETQRKRSERQRPNPKQASQPEQPKREP